MHTHTHTSYLPDQLIPGHLENYSLPLIIVNEDGQVYLNNTTIDGARVQFICSNDVEHSLEQAHAAVCNPDGLNWRPNPANLYSGMCVLIN